MIIGIDVDGVLRDFVGKLTECFKRDYPALASKVQPVTAWDMHQFFGMDKVPFNAYWQTIRGPEIMRDAPPIESHARDFVAALRKAGHKIIISSAQWPCVHSILPVWLQEHGIEYDGLCILADKSLIKLDILLDDGVHNLGNVHAGCIPVCYDQPWNQEWMGTRVHTMSAFYDYVIEGKYAGL